jgi:O-antigen/teichoic acid export membrane protein
MKFAPALRYGLFLYALVLPVIALELPGVIFQVALKMEYPSFLGVFNRILQFVLMVIVVSLRLGLEVLLVSQVISEMVNMVLIWKFSRKFMRPAFRINWTWCLTVLRSSFVLGLAGICVALVNRIDFIMLERMTDLKQVGFYSAAYRVTGLLETLPLMVMSSIYPLMSRYVSEDIGRLKRLYRQSFFYLAVMALPIGIGITWLAPLLIRLIFAAQFTASVRALQILIWSTVFMYMAISGGNLLISIGKEKVNLWILCTAAGINIGLNFIWIPRFGFLGAALSTTVSFGTIFLFTLLAVERYFPKSVILHNRNGSDHESH